MSERRRVFITMEQNNPRFGDIFQDDIMADLKSEADVVLNDLGRRLTTEEFAERARDVDAIITAWGTPRVDGTVIGAAPKLKIIAHSAGSIKGMFSEEIWGAGIVVTNAASAIATYVGEFALTLTLMMLRSPPKYALGAPSEAWDNAAFDGWETLVGKTVGLVGLGNTGRAFVRCLAPFNCRVIAYDPYFAPEKAAELGVELVSLEGLLSTAKVVSMHAPVTDETRGMLGADQLRLIQDGAVFANTARGVLIDHDALREEMAKGRFKAALDVTEPEPLPEDHPLRSMPNVFLTPHTAGPTKDSRRELFKCVVDDLKLFWAGEPVKNRVTKDMLKTMA